MSRLQRWIAMALGLVMTAGVALYVVVAWKMLTYPHEVIVTETAIGLAVRSLLEGTGLYAPDRWLQEPFVIIHYTPLYYLATAAWSMLLGGGLFAGRWVSILATTGAGLVAGHLVRRETGSVPLGLLACALWLSFYQVVFWGTTQRVDALGTLLEGLALLIFVAARRHGRAGLIALPLLVAAWSTKQVMIVGLLAASADLAWEDLQQRRPLWNGRGMRFAAAGFGSLFLIFAGLHLFTGGGFWTAAVDGTVSPHADTPWVIFSNSELFFGSPWNMVMFMLSSGLVIAGLGHHLRPAGPTAAAGGKAPWSPWVLLGAYLWLGLAVAIATDANLPRFFPPMLAMGLIVPLGLHGLRDRRALQAGLMMALLFTAVPHMGYEMRSLMRERIINLHEDNQRLDFARTAARLAPGAGPALAQDAGLLASAELPVIMADPYVFSIMAGNKAWTPEILRQGIREQRYELVVLNQPVESIQPDEWTTMWIAPAKEDLMRHYRLAETLTIEQTWRFLMPTRYYYVRRSDAVTVP